MVQAKNRKDVSVEERENEITKGYVRLGYAIVKQAVEDYVFICKMMKHRRHYDEYIEEKKRLVRFFQHSASFLAPGIDGQTLLDEINRREGFNREEI